MSDTIFNAYPAVAHAVTVMYLANTSPDHDEVAYDRIYDEVTNMSFHEANVWLDAALTSRPCGECDARLVNGLDDIERHANGE